MIEFAEIFTMFPIVGSILVICILGCQIAKQFKQVNNDLLPIISAVLGGVVAVAGSVIGIPALAGLSILDIIATGIVSGFAASGVYDGIANIKDILTHKPKQGAPIE